MHGTDFPAAHVDARPAPARHRRGDRVARFRRRTRSVLLLGLAGCAVLTLLGSPYYFAEPAQRLRSSLHPILKPSGSIGQTLGIVAFVLFAFLWLYPLRKRVRLLAFTGPIGRWLDVHIVAGLLVPVIGAVHAGWRFQGIIGVGYACMLTVSLSGIVGRYLYVHLPRSRDGLALSLDEVDRRVETLVGRIAEAVGESASEIREVLRLDSRPRSAATGVPGSLAGLVSGDLARWGMRRRLRRRWRRTGKVDAASLALALRLADRRAALVQQARMVDATERLFRYWHVAHLPIAITGLVAVTVHVAATVALGVTWFG